ncbi:MAG: molybdate ABC transporter permease subunit [Coriobacteriales bacterium]|nr:molybdate ABC transporter permease subunit [Coriobacteriales bacterium]
MLLASPGVLPLPVIGATPAFAADADAQLEVAEDGSAARLEGATVAIADFSRMNKGTSRPVGDEDLGYHYQMAAANAFAVLVTDANQAIVYLDAEAARQLDFDPANASDKDSLIRLITALDAVAPNGGRPISGLALDFRFTTEREQRFGPWLARFAVPANDGNYYLSIVEDDAPPAGSEAVVPAGDASTVPPAADAVSDASSAAPASDAPPAAAVASSAAVSATTTPARDPSDAALFMLSGTLASPATVQITEAPTGFAAFTAFLASIDMRPFWVSLKTAGVAMIFIFILGILAARLSLRMGARLQGVLDSLFTIPMVLPPTVCGFLLLVLLGNSTPVGRWLVEHGIEMVFSWPAAVIAAAVVGFPLMYRTVRGAFESQDVNLFDAARTLGWSEQRIFFRLMLPLAWPSIAAGTVLAFARAMGEFGATLFVAGNYPGVTQTMPIAIYFQWMGGHSDVATFWVIVTILISFLVILFINWYSSRLQGYRKKSEGRRDAEA